MSDQAPPVDSPEPAPEQSEGAAAVETDWQKRYEDTQSAYTQGQQELSRIRQEKEQHDQLIADLQSTDADVRAQAAQALGLPFEFVDEPPDDEYQGPSEALAREVAAIKEQLASRDQQAQEAQQIALIEQHVEQQLASLDGLNERQRKYVVNTAVAMPPTAEGMPDIKGAYDQWITDMNEEKRDWASTKRTTHRVSPVGEAGAQVPDLNDREARQQWMEERFADLEANS